MRMRELSKGDGYVGDTHGSVDLAYVDNNGMRIASGLAETETET